MKNRNKKTAIPNSKSIFGGADAEIKKDKVQLKM